MFFAENKLKRTDFGLLDKTKSSSFISPSLYLNLYYLPGIFKKPKIAFTCSKKVSNKAVERNRLRRLGFSSMRDFIKNIKSGYVLHFFYKNSAINKSFKEINKEISYLLDISKSLN